MNIADLKQENSRKIAEEVIKSLKLDEDSGESITGRFVFCFEKDDDYLRTVIKASSSILLQLMKNLFETLQKNSPVSAYLVEGILKGAFSEQKNSAD